VAIPLILWLQQVLKNPRYQSWLLFPGLPAICAMEILCVWQANPLRTNRVQGTTHTIEDVLLLSKPGDYVMDNKGDYIFRPRPFYWVLEPVTQARFRQGLIKDNLGACLVRTKTRLSYFYSEHSEPQSALFITMNYMPFDLDALDLGVAARQLGKPSADGTFSFDVAIPLTYAIVSESGDTAGILDGAPYAGPVLLQAGHHTFRRTSGTGRAAFFLADALSLGFRPLFDQADRILDQEQRRIHKVAGKTAD